MRLSTNTHSDILLTHACGVVYKLITILANLHDLHQASNNSKEQDRAKQHNSSAMTTPAVYVPTDPSQSTTDLTGHASGPNTNLHKNYLTQFFTPVKMLYILYMKPYHKIYVNL